MAAYHGQAAKRFRLSGRDRQARRGHGWLTCAAIQSLIPGSSGLTAAMRWAEVLEADYRLDIEDKAMIGRQFEFFLRLVCCVPTSRLWIPDNLAMLDDALEMILRDQDTH
jgi:hypothetical protein